MSEVAQRVDRLEEKIESLEQELKEVKGGKQPSSQITIWGESGAPSFGSKEIGQLFQKIKKRGAGTGVDTNEVESFLEVGRTRALEIMRELGNKHPDLVYKAGKGNRSSKVMVPSKSYSQP